MAASLLAPGLLARLDQLEILARKCFAGRIRGERRSVKKGYGLEFADYRPYAPGDDLRHVDWKVYARLDRLFLKVFLEEEDLFVHVLLDASHSMGMGEPSKLLYGKQLAAALAYIALASTHRVTLFPFAASLAAPLGPLRGKGRIARVLEWLERIGALGETHALESVRHFRRRCLGAGFVVLVSDLLDKDGVERALKELLGGRFEVAVLHVLSPEEEEVSWRGDWKLLDVEDSQVLRVSMSEALAREYSETVRRFRAEHRALCHQLGCVYVPVRTDFPLETLLFHRLTRQGVLG